MAKSRIFNHDKDFDAVENENKEDTQTKAPADDVRCPLENVMQRQQKLTERNNGLAAEFSRLKPDIMNCHLLLERMCKRTGEFTGTIQELQEQLCTLFPVRLSKEDKAMLQKEMDATANHLVELIRQERIALDQRDRRKTLSPTGYWMMVASITLLSLFFALVTYANIEMLRSFLLTKLIVTMGLLTCAVLAAIAYIFHRHKQ